MILHPKLDTVHLWLYEKTAVLADSAHHKQTTAAVKHAIAAERMDLRENFLDMPPLSKTEPLLIGLTLKH
jgi:hypothetical protein